jgi:hypothetical protein
MPVILRDVSCASCGHTHTFAFPANDMGTSREYRYVCPETGQAAALRPDTTAEVTRHVPQGTVHLTVGGGSSPPV